MQNVFDRKFLRLISFCLLAIGLAAAPLTFAELNESPAVAVASQAEALLTADLLRAVKETDKTYRIYNYFNMSSTPQELMTAAGRASFSKRYLDSSMWRFWDMDNHQTSYINAGPGLYAAIDPHISKQFGNTLLVITVPPGVKYLNVVRPVPVSAEAIEALKAENVLTQDGVNALFGTAGRNRTFTRDTLKYMVQPAYKKMRELTQQIVLKNDLAMIEYNWNTSLAGFCRSHSYSAFVLIGKKSMSSSGGLSFIEKFEETLVYGVDLPALTEHEQNTIVEVRNFADLLQNLKGVSGARARAQLIQRHYPDENVRNEIMNTTYSCEK